MLGAMKVYARSNQPVICAPFTLAGANTPASATATVAELNAEATSALAFTQLVRPGCPMIYGHFLAGDVSATLAALVTADLVFAGLFGAHLRRTHAVGRS